MLKLIAIEYLKAPNQLDLRISKILVLLVLAACILSCAAVTPKTSSRLPEPAGLSVASIQAPDLLELTPQMQHFLDRHITTIPSPYARLKRLVYVITHPGILGYEYSPHETYTSAESFDMRSGNCVAFTNMFIAMARAVGLDAQYQEMKVPPSWSERKDILLIALHLNVSVKVAGSRYTVDVARGDVAEYDQTRRLSDVSGATHYYNNLGVDALLEDDLGKAFAYFRKGLQSDPNQSFLWTNVGLIYKRNNQMAEAEWAYNQALKVNTKDFTAMNNLAQIYQDRGEVEQAQKLLDRAERHRLNNPYYLLLLSEDAFARGQLEEAKKLLARAVKRNPNEYRFRFVEAKIAYAMGDFEAAENSYLLAQKLAPTKVRKRDFNIPLSEIMSRAVTPST